MKDMDEPLKGMDIPICHEWISITQKIIRMLQLDNAYPIS